MKLLPFKFAFATALAVVVGRLPFAIYTQMVFISTMSNYHSDKLLYFIVGKTYETFFSTYITAFIFAWLFNKWTLLTNNSLTKIEK